MTYDTIRCLVQKSLLSTTADLHICLPTPIDLIDRESRTANYSVGYLARRLSENSAHSEDCEKLRIEMSAFEENSGAI